MGNRGAKSVVPNGYPIGGCSNAPRGPIFALLASTDGGRQMHKRRTRWSYESARELLAIGAGSAMLVLGAALVVVMSVGAVAS